MIKNIIAGNGSNIRPGSLRGVLFRPDGGDTPAGDAAPPAKDDRSPPAPPAGLDEATKTELAELRAYKEKQADAEKKREREKLDEVDKTKAELADAKAETLAARKETAAAQFGLPPELAELLKGETKSEIEAHAKTLAALLPPKEKDKANTGTPAGGDPTPKPSDALDTKKAELKKALEDRNVMAALKLKTEIAKLETK